MSSVIDLLSQQLEAQYEHRVWDGAFHASQFYRCARILHQHARGQDGPVPDTQTLQIFEDGHSKHAQLQGLLRKTGKLTGEETWLCGMEVDTPRGRYVLRAAVVATGTGYQAWFFSTTEDVAQLGDIYLDKATATAGVLASFTDWAAAMNGTIRLVLSGSRDGKIQLMDYPEIFEIKTLRIDYFDGLREPLPEHVLQVHIYMWITGYTRSAVLLYACKAFPRYKEFRIPYQPAIIDYIREKAAYLWAAKEHPALPTEHILCANGRYKDWCWMKDTCKAYDKETRA